MVSGWVIWGPHKTGLRMSIELPKWWMEIPNTCIEIHENAWGATLPLSLTASLLYIQYVLILEAFYLLSLDCM